MVVYFSFKHPKRCCIVKGVEKNAKSSSCYTCPTRSCSVYSDGLRRVEVDDFGYDFLKTNDNVEIEKIIMEGK